MKSLLSLLLLTISVFCFSQTTEIRKKHYNTNSENVMNDGYDPVSYFSGDPLQGKESFSFEFKGVIYWFFSKSNLEMFMDDPIKYEPQYGGWCAFAMGLKPEKVKVDPETYKIIEGKLYLFYNFYLTNTLKSWNKNEPHLLKTADHNWDIVIQ